MGSTSGSYVSDRKCEEKGQGDIVLKRPEPVFYLRPRRDRSKNSCA